MFRNLTLDNPIGREFIRYASKGKLVPDGPTVDLWQRSVDNAMQVGQFQPKRDTLVLDGIPRNVHQARMLQKRLDVRAIFYLRCRDLDKMVERLQRRALRENRLDDADLKVIRHRLKTYERETEPVLRYYGSKLVHEINSEQSPIHVFHDILDYLINI